MGAQQEQTEASDNILRFYLPIMWCCIRARETMSTKVTQCRHAGGHGASVFHGLPYVITVRWASFFEAEPIPQAVFVQHATALAFSHSTAINDFLLLAAHQCKK